MIYSEVYIFFLIYSAATVLFSTWKSDWVFVSPLLLFLLMTCFRSDGQDMSNYLRNFYGDWGGIHEPLFLMFSKFFSGNENGFTIYLVFCLLVKIYAFRVIKEKLGILVSYLIFLDLVHLYVLRDLSQIRMGLAGAFILLAVFSLRNSSRAAFSLLAVASHFASAPIAAVIISYSLVRDKSWVRKALFYLIAFGAGVTLFNYIAPNFSKFLMYQGSSDRVGYGVGVALGSQLLFFGGVVLANIYLFKSRRLSHDQRTGILPLTLIMGCFGLGWYIYFSDIGIIASRVNSLYFSIYPAVLCCFFVLTAARCKPILLGGTLSRIAILSFGVFLLVARGVLGSDSAIYGVQF